jgi:predicted DNA-binding transcriptional regulator
MNKDNAIGAVILVVSVVVIIYLYLIFFPPSAGLDLFLLKLTVSIAVAGVLGILAWIGYTLITTSSPKPIEEFGKEIDEALGKLKKEMNMDKETNKEK